MHLELKKRNEIKSELPVVCCKLITKEYWFENLHKIGFKKTILGKGAHT